MDLTGALAGAATGPAIPGLEFWIAVWYVILAIGGMGLAGAWMWARRLQWSNWDEVLRGVGTVLISVAMLSFLQFHLVDAGRVLLVLGIASFAMAIRHRRPRHRAALRFIRAGQVDTRFS